MYTKPTKSLNYCKAKREHVQTLFLKEILNQFFLKETEGQCSHLNIAFPEISIL